MSDTGFTELNDSGWTSGLGNMLRKEGGRWWGTRRWLIQLVIWTIALSLMVAFMLYIMPTIHPHAQDTATPLQEGTMMYFELGGTLLALCAAVLTHDAIIGERELGTAAWLMSKPVSRKAFVLSKVIVSYVMVLLTLVLLPSLVVYGILAYYNGSPLDPVFYFSGVAMIGVVCIFYMSMMFIAGTLTTSRYAVLGLAPGFLVMGLLIASQLPEVSVYMPWDLPSLAAQVVNESMITGEIVTRIASTVIYSVAMVVASLCLIERIEI